MRFTFVLALCLPIPIAAQSADDKKATIQFLVGLQQPDGGFEAEPGNPKPKSSLRATSGAIRAIKYLGGEVPNIDKVRAFVTVCYDEGSGTFADTPGGKKTAVAYTAVGMMAVAELQKSATQDRSVAYLAKAAETFE